MAVADNTATALSNNSGSGSGEDVAPGAESTPFTTFVSTFTSVSDGQTITGSRTITSSRAVQTPGSTGTPGQGQQSSSGSSSKTGAIAGGVVGGVIALAILAALLAWLLRRRRRLRRELEFSRIMAPNPDEFPTPEMFRPAPGTGWDVGSVSSRSNSVRSNASGPIVQPMVHHNSQRLNVHKKPVPGLIPSVSQDPFWDQSQHKDFDQVPITPVMSEQVQIRGPSTTAHNPFGDPIQPAPHQRLVVVGGASRLSSASSEFDARSQRSVSPANDGRGPRSVSPVSYDYSSARTTS